ncbi:hypothetical protein [Deinococcus navajonensis]|uniref:Lipoprotein n=1 Tax=Deinococcus navajonensis TaxID=309884 RepID=A0ABV8XKS2_9DEIO
MKRLLMVALGTSGVLASCTTSGSVPYEAVNLTGVQYTSNWSYTDANGQTQYVICDNRDTTVTMNVTWTGPLARLDALFEGATTQRAPVVKTTGDFAPDYSGQDTFTYTFAPGLVPLAVGKGSSALRAQAIVVNPVNRGTSFVSVRGYNPNGLQSNTVQVPQGIPVYNCG